MTEQAGPQNGPLLWPGALEGIRILELGSLIAGPLATRILADFGAEVIKVESPQGGDPLRTWGMLTPYGSLWSLVQSRNKKTVTLDLKNPKAREIVRRLASKCDVVIENFRPGKLEEWGLGYEELKKTNPGLIMVRVSGFGQTGPYRDRPGFGNIAESMGGIRYITGYPDRPPVRVGLSIGDTVAALYAVIGTLLAVHRRDAARAHDRYTTTTHGRDISADRGQDSIPTRGEAGAGGQVVDVALTEAVFSLLESILPEYAAFGAVRERSGNTLFAAAPSNIYRTGDGKWLAIGGNGFGIFRRLTAAMGRPELADDPRFADNPSRVANVQELDETISAWTGSHTMEELLELLEKAEVPSGPVYSIADIVADAQFQSRGMMIAVDDPRVGKVMMPGAVPVLSETPGQIKWAGPDLGAFNREIYSGLLGLSDDEIEALGQEGVI